MGLFDRSGKPVPEPRPDPSAFDATTREVEGFEVPFAEFLCGARVNTSTGRIDVVVHHPLFALLSAAGRDAAARDALETALGATDAADWIGDVATAVDPPIDPLGIPLLGHVVDQLRPLRRRRPR